LLSSYLDGAIVKEDRARVEEHLKSCPDCPGELAALENVVRGVRGLKMVLAPDHFLAKVHERLERPGLGERLSRIILAPPWLKLPLEVAAVAATVLLVYALVYQEPSPYRSPAAPSSKLGLAREEKAKTADAVVLKSAAERRDKAPAVGYAAAPPSPRLRLSLQTVPAQNLVVRAAEKRAAMAEEEGVEVRTASAAGLALDSAFEAPVAGTMPPADMALMDKIQAPTPSGEQDARRQIVDAVRGLGGKETSPEIVAGKKPRPALEVEIPASRYPDLLQALKRFGEVEKPYPPLPPADQGTLRLRIEIL
ncbi:MAG: zf-HC2 domain-containing protein, partial [Candidatus Aureabacteria bacterium]|nr:zf-HC2 domain-containing protein [Candidatus Auribacterota bacterium]